MCDGSLTGDVGSGRRWSLKGKQVVDHKDFYDSLGTLNFILKNTGKPWSTGMIRVWIISSKWWKETNKNLNSKEHKQKHESIGHIT